MVAGEGAIRCIESLKIHAVRRPPGPASGKAWETTGGNSGEWKLRKQYWAVGAGGAKLYSWVQPGVKSTAVY